MNEHLDAISWPILIVLLLLVAIAYLIRQAWVTWHDANTDRQRFNDDDRPYDHERDGL